MKQSGQVKENYAFLEFISDKENPILYDEWVNYYL